MALDVAESHGYGSEPFEMVLYSITFVLSAVLSTGFGILVLSGMQLVIYRMQVSMKWMKVWMTKWIHTFIVPVGINNHTQIHAVSQCVLNIALYYILISLCAEYSHSVISQCRLHWLWILTPRQFQGDDEACVSPQGSLSDSITHLFPPLHSLKWTVMDTGSSKARLRWSLKKGNHAEVQGHWDTEELVFVSVEEGEGSWGGGSQCEVYYSLVGLTGVRRWQDNRSTAVIFVMSGSFSSQIADMTEHFTVTDLTQQTDWAGNWCLLNALALTWG